MTLKANNAARTPTPIHRLCTQTFSPPQKTNALLGIEPEAPPPSQSPMQSRCYITHYTNPPTPYSTQMQLTIIADDGVLWRWGWKSGMTARRGHRGEHQTASPTADVTCATRASSAPAYVARAYSLRTGARQRCVILCIFLVILLYCVYETLLHDGRFQCYNIFSCRHHLRYIC